MTGFLLTAKQKLMLCINKRLYWTDRANRGYRAIRPHWTERANGGYRAIRPHRPVNICTTRKMP